MAPSFLTKYIHSWKLKAYTRLLLPSLPFPSSSGVWDPENSLSFFLIQNITNHDIIDNWWITEQRLLYVDSLFCQSASKNISTFSPAPKSLLSWKTKFKILSMLELNFILILDPIRNESCFLCLGLFRSPSFYDKNLLEIYETFIFITRNAFLHLIDHDSNLSRIHKHTATQNAFLFLLSPVKLTHTTFRKIFCCHFTRNIFVLDMGLSFLDKKLFVLLFT